MTPPQLSDWIDAHAAALTLFARRHCGDPEAVGNPNPGQANTNRVYEIRIRK